MINLAGCVFEERDLLETVINGIRAKGKRHNNKRWVRVMDVFHVGSGVSIALCREFGLNPYEELKK